MYEDLNIDEVLMFANTNFVLIFDIGKTTFGARQTCDVDLKLKVIFGKVHTPPASV